MNAKIIVAVVSAISLNSSFAQEEEGLEEELLSIYGDEELISIATGYSKPISKAPAVATVITADEIKSIGARDVDEVLESVPGLHVARDSLGYNPIYTFRGVYADLNPQVLMLINGVPVTNLFQGDRNVIWGGMPVEAISRVEVIRGPGSAVYGADAFAGVINIITKQGAEIDGVNAGVRVGSFDTLQAWTQIGGENDTLSYALSIEYENTDGQNAVIESDAQSVLDMLTGTNASLAPGSVNLGRESYEVRLDLESGNWHLQSGLQHREMQSGAGVALALDPNNLYSSNRFSTSLSYENADFMGSDWSVSAKGNYFSTTQEVEEDLILYPAGSTGPFFNPITGAPLFMDGEGNLLTFPQGMIGNPDVYEHHYRLDFSALYTSIEGHEIRLGAGYYRGDLYKVKEEKNYGLDPSNPGGLLLPGSPVIDVSDTPYAFITEGDRTNNYLFAQDAWRFANDWELTAGLRYDDYSDFGSTVNPRLALVWSTSHDLTTKLLYGEAFRAPSFAQTRNINNPSFLGNSSLKPEEMKSYELAFDYRPGYNMQFNMNLFYYEWDDIILFVSDPGGVSRTAQNAGEQTGHGFEVEGTWQALDSLNLSGNFAWVETTDERTDTPAGNAPEKQLYLRADWDFLPEWSLNVQANWVMDRERVYLDTRPDIDDYLMVDSKLRFTPFAKSWEASLILRNLFNEDAREPSPNGVPVALIPNDLPLAGRTISGEVRFRFH